jgi:triacylglycerol esterase/lipase EstA (alpha/beta hydrolase family)
MALPVLLVHGIWDTGQKLAPMARALEAAGVPRAHALTLSKNDGSAPISALAEEVAAAARALGPRVDLVGFSMGALVSRYAVQRLGLRAHVRRFVSIAGPHAGTRMAGFLPWMAGVRDMRVGSALLAGLAADPDPWGEVEVHVLYTPYDLMIVPATSARLPSTKSETKMPIAMHRWLVTDPRALAHVAAILTAD